MKKVVLTILAVVVSLIIVLVIAGLIGLKYINNQFEPVDPKSMEQVIFNITEGDTYYSIAPKLKENNLIKDEKYYKLYIKINKPVNGLKVGEYYLSPNMSIEEIVTTLSGRAISKDITITFKEGKNMKQIAKTIAANTNNSEQDVYNKLKDKNYLNKVINKYWFIDKSILDSKIYYPLEGYLYPETYNFRNKDVTVEDIFDRLLDETDKKLTPYKEVIINNKKYNAHNILTLASMIELEAKSDNDRAYVASVFYNRLNIKMNLGSDVTTYYDSQVDMSERDLYKAELLANHGYNTRSASMIGLPVGPICNPSISSIKAAIEPKKSDYIYFVADNKGKVYFNKTYYQHQTTIAKLKNEGLWERY